MNEAFLFVFAGAFSTSTPLLIAALGELICEKSGVLNLSVEGMMALGAAVAFVIVNMTGSHTLGFLGGSMAGAALSLVMAVLVLQFLANQVAAGLAVGLLGLGISALVGRSYEGQTGLPLARLPVPGLSKLPYLGFILFNHDVLVYLAYASSIGVAWFLYRSRPGLILRVVGENAPAAHALGLRPLFVRLLAIVAGGALAGLAGAYAATVLTPLWSQGMIAGRGWIAIALVIFGAWRPFRIVVGAYFFGAISLVDLAVQALGISIPPQLLTCLPYLTTIIVLAIVSRDAVRIRLNAPASLGQSYQPAI